MRRTQNLWAAACFGLALLATAWLAIVMLLGGGIDAGSLCVMALLILVPLVCGACLQMRALQTVQQKNRLGTRIVWLMGIVYVIALCALLFLGRPQYAMWSSALRLSERLSYNANFIPFFTLSGYARALLRGHINPSIVVENVLGNVLLFLPMGLLLPRLCPRLRKWGPFLLCMIGMLCAVEVLQFCTYTGSLDVDDVLLNLLGACVGFALYRSKWVQRLCRKLYLIPRSEPQEE